MHESLNKYITIENHLLKSVYLERDVKVDCYVPVNLVDVSEVGLLLINDGQDLVTMNFQSILHDLYKSALIRPLLCVGMHCSSDRKNEYATASTLDYKGRGTKAAMYTKFVLEEVIPYLKKTFKIVEFTEKSFAGFSLGGLSALDIVWSNAGEFTRAGIFSGSFWWRDKAQEDPSFNENTDRIMHRLVRQGTFDPGLSFYFEVGTQDETADRNNNGIIDAIDDTLSLIHELQKKGYADNQLKYVELQDGRHNVATWARAFPDFLKWGWQNS